MATPKQEAANRRNARKSTGPKSAEGKNAVRLNALSHGLRSEAHILPGESRDDFEQLDEQFFAEFQPQGQLETFLLGQMITCAWRLRRVARVETGLFAHFQENTPMRQSYDTGVAGDLGEDAETSSSDLAPLGLAFIKAGNTADVFTKVSRYEVTIRAGFYRAYDELQRLRAARGAVEPAVEQI